MPTSKPLLPKKLLTKALLKQDIYKKTLAIFQGFNQEAKQITVETRQTIEQETQDILLAYQQTGTFSFYIKFGSDMLVFAMHSNVFEFPRAHPIKQTDYIKQDPTRSYCGEIKVYNFLADSYKYNRTDDIGYLVARIFINKENHFCVEGKKQRGFVANTFSTHPITPKDMHKIIESAMLYCIDFDLLAPPYEDIKLVSVEQMQNYVEMANIKTGKRLGFRFQADHDEETTPHFSSTNQ